MFEERLNCHSDVAANLAQQDGADVAPGVKWDGGGSPIGVAVKPVCTFARATDKFEPKQDTFDLGGSEHRNSGTHNLRPPSVPWWR